MTARDLSRESRPKSATGRRWWLGSRWVLLIAALLMFMAMACGGGGSTVDPAPQLPAPAVQPAPAAPAPEARPAPAVQAPVAPLPVAPPQAAPVAGSPSALQPKYGGIFVVANRGDPPQAFDTLRTINFDLHTIGGGLNGNGNVVRPCRADAFQVCPGIAESWENSKDFTQWTFKIRNDVRWHDGKPFTAEDAKFWFDLGYFGAKVGDKVRAPSSYQASFGDLQKVEALEGNRLRITLSRADPQYLYSISGAQYAFAHPTHLMKPLIEKGQVNVSPLDVGVISIGPFKMLKYEKGSRVLVRRNDLYWEKDEQGRQLPYLEGIDWAIIRDPSAMDAAFRVGRLDGGARGLGHELSKERQAGYIRDLGDKVWFFQVGGGRLSLAFNLLRPGPWQDVRVRKAIALWIDKQASGPSLAGGFGELATLLAPDNPYTSLDFTTWPGYNAATKERDRAEAKRLMAEAGHSKGFPMTHLVPSRWLNRAEFLHAQVAGLGIELKLVIVDEAGWDRGRVTLDYDTLQGGAGGVSPVVPEQTEWLLTRFSISNYSPTKHEDPKLPELFDRLRATPNVEQRIKVWRDLERYVILDQALWIPFTGGLSVVPYRTYVKGMVLPKEGIMNDTEFATVWLDK